MLRWLNSQRRILGATITSARDATLLIREALFAMDVRTWPYNEQDVRWVLNELVRGLEQPFLLPQDSAEQLISDARSMASAIKREPHTIEDHLIGYEEVARILQPILERLPSADTYLAALEQISPNLRGPLLEAEYHSARNDYVAFMCLVVLKELGERDTLLKLLKQRLLTIPPYFTKAYKATKELAENFLRDEFPGWWEKQIRSRA